MKRSLCCLLLILAAPAICADDWLPRRVTTVPYRYQATPLPVHASFQPGSPKWFVPGYGYQVPAVAYRRPTDLGLSVYRQQSWLGSRRSDVFYGGNQRFWVAPNALPWFLPGATTGTVTQSRRFEW